MHHVGRPGMLTRAAFIARTVARLHPRTLSSSSSSAQQPEQSRVRVRVPCNSNGSVDLDVYYPHGHSPTASRTACIYLPRGPILQHAQDDESNISALRGILRCPVVQINYRHGVGYKHPQPVFDTAAGYDWVVNNLLDCPASSRSGRQSTGKVAVCGELVGGTLATTLALTECRTDEPAAVVAAAVNNAVLNWTDFDEAPKTSARRRISEKPCIDSKELCQQRNLLFHKPVDYYDPFASPVLFFRAAGSKVPPPAMPLSEMDELAEAEREEFLQSQAGFGGIVVDAAEVTRKSSRRFPSRSLALRLPRFSIRAGDSVLSDQAAEFSRLLQKAFERQQKLRSSRGRGMARMAESTSEDMVELKTVTSLGLWDQSTAGRTSMRDTALWLDEALHG